MTEDKLKEVQNDLPIILVHVLTAGILSATILFLLLRYNKNFNEPKLRYIITILALLFCFVSIAISIYAISASIIHSNVNETKDKNKNKNIFDIILNKIPIFTSSVLLIISILLFYIILNTSISLFF